MLVSKKSLYQSLFKVLANKRRQGLIDYKVWPGDTILEHSINTRKIVIAHGSGYLTPAEIERASRMAIYHDFQKAFLPDITQQDGFSARDKETLRNEALVAICHLRFPQANVLVESCEEYMANATRAATFTHWADKYEFMEQVLKAERRNASPYSFQPAWDLVGAYLKDSPLKPQFERLVRMRPIDADEKPLLAKAPLSCPERKELIRTARHKINCFKIMANGCPS